MPGSHSGVAAERCAGRGTRLAACAPAPRGARARIGTEQDAATDGAVIPSLTMTAVALGAAPDHSSGAVPDPRARRIADAITTWLACGVHLDPATCAFLEAQLGVPGLAGLSAMDAAALLAPLLGAGSEGQAASGLTNTADAEGALEYLLYPDAALRLSVERVLAECIGPDAGQDAAPVIRTAIAPAIRTASGPTIADASCVREDSPCEVGARLADAVLAQLPPEANVVVHIPDVPGTPDSPSTPDPPDSRSLARLVLPVPRWAMTLLVRRLRLDRVIPAPVAAVVASSLPEPQALAVRLALRDARFALTEPSPAPCADTPGTSAVSPRESRPDLVLRFIRRMPSSDPRYIDALALWLDLLHDLPPGKSAHAALSARRERLARAAREADEFTARLARLNMEILMLQGVHAPALDAAEARRQVRLMDRMCLAVLGRPAALDPTEEGMGAAMPGVPGVPGVLDGHDLGAFDPATGLDDLMRLLS
ncbi:MAG TPA: hypothetical protein VE028_06490 [Nitratidesulfovibrio sp.]|nr:hypothetical protein [Nitratidesulfovibrio sp.]